MKNYPIKIIKVSNPMFSGSRKPKNLFLAIIDNCIMGNMQIISHSYCFQNDVDGFRQNFVRNHPIKVSNYVFSVNEAVLSNLRYVGFQETISYQSYTHS